VSNGRIDTAQIEAILAGDQDAVNKYLVTTLAEVLATCRGRPAQCAAARSRQWSHRRVLGTWLVGVAVSLLSAASLIIALIGG